MNQFFKSRSKMLVMAIVLASLIMGISGCSQRQEAAGPATGQLPGAYLTITDDNGREVTLPKKPERVVILAPSFVDIYYAVGGKAVGRAVTTVGVVPPEARSVPVVSLRDANLEKVIELQPDLVIALQGISENYIPILDSSRIPMIILRMKTYEDVLVKMKLFGDIAGTREQARHVTETLNERVTKLKQQAPPQSKKVVILHATAKSITVELENSIAGSVAKMLNLQNVAAGDQALDGNPEVTPYSMEALVERDPDIIFVTVMGDQETIGRRMQADVESNPAWSSLRAVQNKQVFFLPMELFLLSPGIRYDEAVTYMGKLVYPEIY